MLFLLDEPDYAHVVEDFEAIHDPLLLFVWDTLTVSLTVHQLTDSKML